jgi:hypothetical protein
VPAAGQRRALNNLKSKNKEHERKQEEIGDELMQY